MSKNIDVTAKKKVGEETREITVNTAFGETVEESITMFGADVVNTNFIASSKITLQAVLRRMLSEGKSEEEINAVVATWKPGVAVQRSSDPAAAMLSKFAGMDKKEQAEYIKALQTRAAGK